MFQNNLRAVVINLDHQVYKRKCMIRQMKTLGISDYTIMNAVDGENVNFSEEGGSVIFDDTLYEYGVYAGDFPFRKQKLNEREIGCALSNHICHNNQLPGHYTIVFEDDATYIGSLENWEKYVNNLPSPEDYDIILLSDCSWKNSPYPQGEEYNEYYYRLTLPHFDISGTHAYIVNPHVLGLLNEQFSLLLAADDFLNYCINRFQLRVLVPNEVLFTQHPENYRENKDTRQYKILFYTCMWHMDDNLSKIPRREGFELLTDRACFDEADVVVFHMPTLEPEDEIFQQRRKRNGQLWVFWSMECELNYPWHYKPEVLALFDITMTYKLNADIPVPYIYSVYYDWLRRTPTLKTGLVNAFISSNYDQSHRLSYLKELMKYLAIHSYGKVFNNRQLQEDEGLLTKGNIMKTYKFSLAFENARAVDYVTEKFYHPLILGSVPIYLGAPNVDDFAPADHCYINVDSFSSVRALADYIIELDQDDQKYNAYLKWKTQPYRESFTDKAELIYHDPFMTLYQRVKNILDHQSFVAS